ncbi:MAG: response regulator [Anaerolineae bacterium]
MANILIIDDEVMTVQMLAALLKVIGHETLSATSATEAMQVLSYNQPDVILLDIMLPDVNGLQLCYDLRSAPQTAETPIFMISATAPPLIDESYAAGANGYIAKPLTLKEIRSALATVGIK